MPDVTVYGKVAAILGMLVEIAGLEESLSIGSRVDLVDRTGNRVPSEVVGFRDGRALAMSFGSLDGVGLGSRAVLVHDEPAIRPTNAWLGRVVNALGEPIDGKGPLPLGHKPCRIRNAPPPAHLRARVGGKIDLGVRAINTFTTVCKGQRLGIFAASVVLFVRSMGAMAPMGIIEIIGLSANVLSYARLMALGIAGIAFADIANGMPAAMGIVGVIGALFVHIFNFGLSVFSPTIHSLRLNLVEFLPKFYETEGRPYQPFRKDMAW